MMVDVIAEIRTKIADYNQQISEYLLAGNSASHEDYMKQVGKAHAFRLILQDLEELEQKYIEE